MRQRGQHIRVSTTRDPGPLKSWKPSRRLASMGAETIAAELGRSVQATRNAAYKKLGISLRRPGSTRGLVMGQHRASFVGLKDLVATSAVVRSGELRRLRVQAGISQSQLAAAIGVQRETLYRWERGKTRPQGETLERLSQAVKILEKASYENLRHRGGQEASG